MKPRVLLGLLGYPIAHSAAPAMMEAAGASVGLDLRYHLIAVQDANDDTIRRILDGLRLIGFAGINVTFPYKQAVIPHLDALDDGARQIGAVNCITVRDGRLTGHNTDSTGFLAALLATIGSTTLRTGPAVLIGAGGAGRAIAWALSQAGVPEVRVVDQDPTRAAALAAEAGEWGPARFTPAASAESAAEGARGIVNASPAGMLPDTTTPLDSAALHPGHWVADAVYHPHDPAPPGRPAPRLPPHAGPRDVHRPGRGRLPPLQRPHRPARRHRCRLRPAYRRTLKAPPQASP
ncbi:shikimate dehydrogenase family protein [Roseomonas sp. CCTCC AB2023176]|uniref:shikimate dehydrogenase family protein n=1 Tax=Roseomonas sp. CCTCC AB2023176 TaxID=3342640 RepID=UPI0035E3859C